MSEFPAGWEQVSGIAYCLSCSRKRAGEAKAAPFPTTTRPPITSGRTPRAESNSS
jgi:hypothetical protein